MLDIQRLFAFSRQFFFFFFSGKRLHSLERSPLFTEILDFLYPGKKPGRLTQPTHGVPSKGLLLFPAQPVMAAPVMTIINDLGTLILKLRAQLLAFPWQHDPSTGHVTHPAHDIMRNTHNVFKEYSTFLFTGEMFREMTFFLRNSSFTVLGTGECVLGSVEYRQLRS